MRISDRRQRSGQSRNAACRLPPPPLPLALPRASLLPSLAAQATMTMVADAAADLPQFDADNPLSYYMVDSQADMEALSDAVLVAAGVRLPVHSQVGAAVLPAACEA